MRVLIEKKGLLYLILAYIMAATAANWFDARHIQILGLSTGGGSIAFPFTYILADVITEVYGYKNTRMTLWIGLVMQSLFIFYARFLLFFISPNSEHRSALNILIELNNWIIIASFANYIISETANSFLVAKMKIWFKGRFIGIRFVFSTFIAYAVDELIYAPIAFHSFLSGKNLVKHMFDSWLFMVVIEILMLPISVRLAQYMKSKEQVDIYDTKTDFTPFSLNTTYHVDNNHYRKDQIK